MRERRGILPLLLLCFGVSAAVLWPLPFSPHPHDHSDTLFNTWLTAWNHHAVINLRNPVETPQFSGFPDGQGRNDILLTQWMVSLPLRLATGNPVRIHNLLFWISLALSGFAAAKLAEDRGATVWGAAFAAAAFITLPYFKSHLWHLQLQSAGLALAGLMFALRIVEGRGPRWPLALLIPLQGLASLYHWYFLNLALTVVGVTALFTKGRRHVGVLVVYTLLGNGLLAPFLVPHMKNAGIWDVNTITSTDAASFVSPWQTGYATGWLRSRHAHPEAALWPGLAILAGAAWAVRGKTAWNGPFLPVLGLFFAAYSLGPTMAVWGMELAPGPFRLAAALPGGTAIRLPARAGYLALLPLLIPAAKQLGKKPGWALAGMALALGEAAHPGVSRLPVAIPEYHEWIAGQNPGRILYLPVVPDLDRPEVETQRLFSATRHFAPSVNGYSTSLPRGYHHAALVLDTWPSRKAVELVTRMEIDLIISEGFVPDDADESWYDGRVWTGALWLNR